jgi:hypothetical protein
MKSLFFLISFAAFLTISSVGCAPKPVADEGEGRPAADVTVTTETTEAAPPLRNAEPEGTGVDVQVGGGQGVQVEVDREPNNGN